MNKFNQNLYFILLIPFVIFLGMAFEVATLAFTGEFEFVLLLLSSIAAIVSLGFFLICNQLKQKQIQ